MENSRSIFKANLQRKFITNSGKDELLDKVTVLYININSLKENPYQPRMEIDEDSIKELAESIEKNGLLQPISVYEYEKDKYYIIAGHRRVEAHRLLGKNTIRAIVSREESNIELAEKSIVENLQRKDLNILELAIAVDKYRKEFGKTIEESAEKFGKTKDYVSRLLKVLELPEEILEDLRKNKSTKDVKALADINSLSKKLATPEFDKDKLKELQIFLYFGFLENGREWLKNEIKSQLSKENEKKEANKSVVSIKKERKRTVFAVKIPKLSDEKIQAIQEYIEKIVNNNEEQ